MSVGCPSRMHDANVFQSSRLDNTGLNGCQQGAYHLLADAAYPLLTWVMTPYYRDNGLLTDSQKDYNKALSSKRQIIERCFGILTKRFPRMHVGIDIISMDGINELIMSACIIHNIMMVWMI